MNFRIKVIFHYVSGSAWHEWPHDSAYQDVIGDAITVHRTTRARLDFLIKS